MAKASDNPFPSILLVEQAAAPATPAAGHARLYRGTDNKLYIVDDAGVATEVGAAAYTDEQVRDVIAAALVAGTGMTITPDDAGDTITLAASGGGGSGGVLVSKSYNPATSVVPALTATDADIDATNLAVTFTAPASGVVLVRVGVVAICNPDTNVVLTIRSGTTQLGRQRVLSGSGSTPQQQVRVTPEFRIAGLTSGTSYTYKLGGYYVGAGTAPLLAYGDDGTTNAIGPVTLSVLAG